MAAHAYTVLKNVAAGKEDPAQFKHGLSYAPFGDNIGLWRYDDWCKLQIACDQGKDALVALAQELLPIYEDRWRNMLGCPATCEEWNANLYRIWKLMNAMEK